MRELSKSERHWVEYATARRGRSHAAASTHNVTWLHSRQVEQSTSRRRKALTLLVCKQAKRSIAEEDCMQLVSGSVQRAIALCLRE
jgi:hypothetical protein